MKDSNYIIGDARRNPIPELSLFYLKSKGLRNRVEDLGKINSKINPGPVASPSDMFRCIRPFLIFGKVIGVIRICGLFTGNLDQLTYRKCSLSGFVSILIITILTLNTGIALAGYLTTGGKDATQLAKNAAASVCYGMGLYVYVFIFLNTERLVMLFRKWREVELVSDYGERDERLWLSYLLIAGVILGSAISENAISHLLLFPLHEGVSNPLKYYYESSHSQWAGLIPYNPVVAIGVFLCNKWAVYAWNFGDILIILTARAIYGRFKGFIEVARERLVLAGKGGNETSWEYAIQDHDELCKLTEDFAHLLSPLVFASFAVNIYFICIQLNLFLAPSSKTNFLSSLYGSWSFLHLLSRTYAVALSAAKINDYAHEFGKLLSNCPKEFITPQVERAERKLATYPTALHGLGTFYISRPFILSVISVIFTFEIVLLTTPQIMSSQKEKISFHDP